MHQDAVRHHLRQIAEEQHDDDRRGRRRHDGRRAEQYGENSAGGENQNPADRHRRDGAQACGEPGGAHHGRTVAFGQRAGLPGHETVAGRAVELVGDAIDLERGIENDGWRAEPKGPRRQEIRKVVDVGFAQRIDAAAEKLAAVAAQERDKTDEVAAKIADKCSALPELCDGRGHRDDPSGIDRQQKDNGGQAEKERQQRNRIDAPARGFQHFEIDIFVDGDAEIAQGHQRQIDGIEHEKQCQFRAVDHRIMKAAGQNEKADDRGNGRQHDIQDEDHGGLAGNRAQRLFFQEAAAQIDEQHLHDADVGQIERIAKRCKKDEQREPLRREYSGEHKRLQQTRGQCASRRRGA